MTTATLNIGLDTNDGHGISVGRVLSELVKTSRATYSSLITAVTVRQSTTELTAVIGLARPLTDCELYNLSEATRQEAVAQLDSDGNGALVGPKAHLWGQFDRQHFITL